MGEKLQQLVYVSKSNLPMDLKQVMEISSKAQERNRSNHVTGLLIYRNGYFLQLLEGNIYDVHHIFKRIGDDPRHTSIRVLIDEPVGQRLFPQWGMIYKTIDAAQPDLLKDVTHLLENRSDEPTSVLNALWDLCRDSA